MRLSDDLGNEGRAFVERICTFCGGVEDRPGHISIYRAQWSHFLNGNRNRLATQLSRRDKDFLIIPRTGRALVWLWQPR